MGTVRASDTVRAEGAYRGDGGTPGDADLAAVGAVLADRARCSILLALADGRALPASVLASEAGIAASTASSHLGRLADAGLVTVRPRGRYRYYALAGPSVAELVETLARLAPAQPVRSLREGTRAHAIRRARTCYDHLAGRLGVDITGALVDAGALSARGVDHDAGDSVVVGHGSAAGAGDQAGYTLEPAGAGLFNAIGVDLPSGSWVRCCVDWTEQRHHVAGGHGRALLSRLLELQWLARAPRGRAVTLTESGCAGLHDWIGLDVSALT